MWGVVAVAYPLSPFILLTPVLCGQVPLTGDQKTKDYSLDVNESWALDVVMSTGTGKPAQSSERTTVYKRSPDAVRAIPAFGHHMGDKEQRE